MSDFFSLINGVSLIYIDTNMKQPGKYMWNVANEVLAYYNKYLKINSILDTVQNPKSFECPCKWYTPSNIQELACNSCTLSNIYQFHKLRNNLM